jgi:hypothetical protein
MRRHYRAIALAISLAAATVATAQTSPGDNPIRRGGDGEIFSYGPLNRNQPQSTFGRGPLDQTGIGRPNPRGHHQVTPVPEPSQWAMMLAGLALVGFIARRSSRSRDSNDSN